MLVKTYDHGFECDVFQDGRVKVNNMWNIEKKPGKLSALQERHKNGINRTGREFVDWAKKRRTLNGYSLHDNVKPASGSATARIGGLDGVAYRNVRSVSAEASVSRSPEAHLTTPSDPWCGDRGVVTNQEDVKRRKSREVEFMEHLDGNPLWDAFDRVVERERDEAYGVQNSSTSDKRGVVEGTYDRLINHQGPLFRAVGKVLKKAGIKYDNLKDDENVEAAVKNMYGKIRHKAEVVDQRCSSRTQCPDGPAMTLLRLHCQRDTQFIIHHS